MDYPFTLQLEGPSVFDPDVLEALIAAGCDDGLFVAAWFRDVVGEGLAVDRTPAITRAINAALDLRRAESRLSPTEAAPISSWMRPYIESRSA